jgi:WD repeat-containing protein 48
MRHRLPILNFDFPLPATGEVNSAAQELKSTYTPWSLWDDRYWIRLKLTPGVHQPQDDNEDQSSLIQFTIRPLQPSDLRGICQMLDEVGYREDDTRFPSPVEFLDALSREAPGPIRFTMPLLTVKKPDEFEEQPLALLTVPITNYPARMILSNSRSWQAEWEWTYKMVDPEPLKLMGWLKEIGPLHN